MILFNDNSIDRPNFNRHLSFRVINEENFKVKTDIASQVFPESCMRRYRQIGSNQDIYRRRIREFPHRTKMIKLSLRNNATLRNQRIYNNGRWSEDEHRRFIEAILKYGNDWKKVQSHIKTRSSTQTRSHSQKFFMKLKNFDFFDFKEEKPSITSLVNFSNTLSPKEIAKFTNLLITCEYHELQFRKIHPLSNCKLLGYKRKNSMELLSTVAVEKDDYIKKNEDDFKKIFLNIFNREYRRVSFDDPYFLLSTNSSGLENSSSNYTKDNSEREDFSVDSFIDLN